MIWTKRMDEIAANCASLQEAAVELGIPVKKIKSRRSWMRKRGKPVAPTRSASRRERKPDPERGEQVQYRRCLACSKRFLSQWIGERVCKRCKGTEVYRAGSLA